MSCSRLRRELLDLFRFGELDGRSAPHLDHLVACRACRDEVGLDRALVQQLRVALAERVAGTAPSPEVWPIILRRAQAPPSGLGAWLRSHWTMLANRLRIATAVSAVALAALVASGQDVTQPGGPWPSPQDLFVISAETGYDIEAGIASSIWAEGGWPEGIPGRRAPTPEVVAEIVISTHPDGIAPPQTASAEVGVATILPAPFDPV
jgi:hypothetical protein